MKTSIKIFIWLPRIICMMAILFISLFAFDSFGKGMTIWQQLQAFSIHMIPSLVLLGILVVAWKRDLLGGILFLIIGIGFSPYIFQKNLNMNHSVLMSLGIIMAITVPFIVVGILFIVNHFKKKGQAGPQD